MGADERVAKIAERQDGLVSVPQARAAGLSDKAIRHRLEQGRWQRARRGVYTLRGTADTWSRDVLAAILAAGEAALASHATAARLWELPIGPERPIEIVVPIEDRRCLTDIIVHRSGCWNELDLAIVHGIPTTSVARTMVDLSNRLGDRRFEELVDEALRRRILSLSALTRCAERFSIAAGRSPNRLRRVLASRTPDLHPTESVLESRVVRVLMEAGLPTPVRQLEIPLAGRRFRADLAYPDRGIVIEVDGFDFHRSRGAFDHDRERQNLLVLSGLTILRFTSRSTDAEIVQTVASALFGELYAPEGRQLSKRGSKRSGGPTRR